MEYRSAADGLPRRPLSRPRCLQLWLAGRGGNANFLFGMNLLWGGMLVVLLLRLLRAAARAEAATGQHGAASHSQGAHSAGGSGQGQLDVAGRSTSDSRGVHPPARGGALSRDADAPL